MKRKWQIPSLIGGSVAVIFCMANGCSSTNRNVTSKLESEASTQEVKSETASKDAPRALDNSQAGASDLQDIIGQMSKDDANPPTITEEVKETPDSLQAGLPKMGDKVPYSVKSGDSLSRISRRIFGKQEYWRSISKLSGIKNPDLIFPGETIYFPMSEESAAFVAKYSLQK